MEQIVYRKTLDVHKNGVQFTLQGFETNDKMARRVEVGLMASGDTIDFPLEQISAAIYVTTPNATEPSINKCTIKDNKIIYDVLPIVEEGITEVQIKLIETRIDGAKSVLATPKFAIEVTKSNTDDDAAMQSTTFTALEDAIAKAESAYATRLERIELDSDCMFRAYYADGVTYESDVLKELFLKGDALISQSYARGGTGVRAGEDTDNSMYYSNVSKSASQDAKNMRDDTEEVLEEVRKHGVYTAFSVDFTTGEVEYVSPSYGFDVNEKTGELDVIGETYTFEETIQEVVNEWLTTNGANIGAIEAATLNNAQEIADLKNITTEHTQTIADTGNEIQKLNDDIASNKENIEVLQETSSTHTQKIQNLEELSNGYGRGIYELQEKGTAIKFPLYLCETRATGMSIFAQNIYCNRQGNVYWLYGTISDINTINTNAETEERTFWFSEGGREAKEFEKFSSLPSFKQSTLVTRYSNHDSNQYVYTDNLIMDVSGNTFKIKWQTTDVEKYDLHFNMMFVIEEPRLDG